MLASMTMPLSLSSPTPIPELIFASIFAPPQEDEDAMDMVTRVASVMHLYPPRHVLSGEYVHDKWNPSLVCATRVV